MEFVKDSESELVQKQPIDLASGLRAPFIARRVIQSPPKSCPRWQTVRTARDENALKLVATEKLSSFFLLSVREVLAVAKK